MASNRMQRYAQMKGAHPGIKEGLRASLYDFQTYDNAGYTELKFFQIPIGQQLGGSSRTNEDTNLLLAGQLEKGQKFIAESIEVLFLPGSDAGSYVRAPIVSAAAAIAAPTYSNDVHAFYSSGALKMKVGTKEPVEEAPLLRFPPRNGLMVSGAATLENEAAGANQIVYDYARANGQVYYLAPEVVIEGGSSFSVTMQWANKIAMPSGFDGRVGVVLNGILIRQG